MKTHVHFGSYRTPFFLEWEIFSDKNWIESEYTPYVQCPFILVENRTVYEIMWKNMAEPDRSQITIQYNIMLNN